MTAIPKGGLVVSCQARADNPLHGPVHMAAMAQAAEQGGAVALRVNGPDDIAAVRRVTALPIIGLYKLFGDAPVYITPTRAAAMAVIDAGADIVALDCTGRPREGEPWPALIEAVHAAGHHVLADISTLDEGLAAAAAGADYVATTLSGYTDATASSGPAPDLALIAVLAAATGTPVIAEGRYDTPALAAQALAAGAHAVVVGTAITNPRAITQRFVAALSPDRITP